MEMVAQCFEQLALALNTHGALALTDSFSHHCWFFPPVDAHSQLDGGDVACNCGSLLVHEVPVDSDWSVVGTTDISTLNPFLQHLKHCSSQHHANSGPHTSRPPHVFDLLTPRIAALGCASDLSEIALTTAFIVTHN